MLKVLMIALAALAMGSSASGPAAEPATAADHFAQLKKVVESTRVRTTTKRVVRTYTVRGTPCRTLIDEHYSDRPRSDGGARDEDAIIWQKFATADPEIDDYYDPPRGAVDVEDEDGDGFNLTLNTLAEAERAASAMRGLISACQRGTS